MGESCLQQIPLTVLTEPEVELIFNIPKIIGSLLPIIPLTAFLPTYIRP